MSACLLLEPLEMSVVFGLSIYTATANSSNVGNENMVLELFWGENGGGGILVRAQGWEKLQKR